MAGIQLIYDTTCTSTSGVGCSWTVPAGTRNVVFEIWGGGGGGGTTGTNCDCCSRGGPGAGGGYSKVSIATTPGTVYSMCAGPGGISSQGYGSYCGICCDGCVGGTTYITGAGLSNFCATGGYGGTSDFNTNCYAHCGCNFYSRSGGQGYGGDVIAKGGWGVMGSYSGTSPYHIDIHAGSAAGPGGGVGGVQIGGGLCNNSWYAASGEDPMHGRIPGGGGSGNGSYSCCCCAALFSGRGAPGAIKIYY